jgi:seryl-tRNA synthetase
LGSIELEHVEDEIDIFDWASTSAEALETITLNASSASDDTSDLKATVEKLQSQLQELSKEHEKQETELFEKFAKLLNTKKAKIRDLERALQNSTVPDEAAMSEDDGDLYIRPGPSGAKRKAASPMDLDEEETSPDPMPVEEQEDTTESETE